MSGAPVTPRCREEQIAARQPYPKSNCELCGSILRPGWRCAKADLAALRASHAEMLAAMHPEILDAIADEIECFEHSARCASLRLIAKQQRTAIARAEALT